jgi:hypothetical protein
MVASDAWNEMVTHETLEGELADQKLSGLLVATNLTKSDGTGLVAVRLLDATGRGSGLASGLGCQLLSWGLATGTLASSLGGQLLTRGLATSGLAGSLLCASHCCECC